MIPEKLTQPYNPQETEDKIYKLWEESGFFNPDNLPEHHKEPFTIIMPPPNANGSLHAGHAMMLTIEDLMIRYKRMQGFRTLWLPGADHAGFETQVVYEKILEKEGRSRFKMDRKEFYDEVMKFTLGNKTYMENQIRKMGSSCDWSRTKFTLDEDIIKTVYNTFKKLEDDKLLYRGNRIINWCVKHQTALSGLETETVTRVDKFYYLKYGPFIIGTARPETKFGDKYVVMHPDDKRYKEYKHGQKIDLEWINGPITATIIKDEAIDMEFGTGVMTITPCHDLTDFEISERHHLDREQIIDFYGKLLPIAGEFEGMSIAKARDLIIEKLDKKGLVEKIDEKYEHTVQTCYKCNRILEPQIKPQWFIKMSPLAKEAVRAVEEKKTTFVTEKFEKIFNHWMSTIQDWNISRQIAWGIPIPAKLCTACDHAMVDIEGTITKCEKCDGAVIQDPDTFDTWFSSGQWPYATLGYPDGSDFKTFYPTDVMETGQDILFFWVARMLMLGIYRTGDVPFKSVYMHGMVTDKHGKKMSKSKGNVINPIDITDKFGTDALRMGLIIGNTPGTDLALSEDKIKGYKHFANKLWNVTRFILTNTEDLEGAENITYTKEDEEIIAELKKVINEVTNAIEGDKFHLAGEKLYHYVWHTLADKIIEESKEVLAGDPSSTSSLVGRGSSRAGQATRLSRQKALLEILTTTTKLLHPFMPFITEEIWSLLPTKTTNPLIIEQWPV